MPAGTENADDVVHVFRTPFGIPPAKDDRPICGAVLTDAYDFAGPGRPHCRACDDLATSLCGGGT